jgi:hypothetical protein
MGLTAELLSQTVDEELAIYFLNAVDCCELKLITEAELSIWLNELEATSSQTHSARSRSRKATDELCKIDRSASANADFGGEDTVRTIRTFQSLISDFGGAINSSEVKLKLHRRGVTDLTFLSYKNEQEFVEKAKILTEELNAYFAKTPTYHPKSSWFAPSNSATPNHAERLRDILGLGHLPPKSSDLRGMALTAVSIRNDPTSRIMNRPSLFDSPSCYFRAKSDEEHRDTSANIKPEGRTVDLVLGLPDGLPEGALTLPPQGYLPPGLSVEWLGFTRKPSVFQDQFSVLFERLLRGRALRTEVNKYKHLWE